MTHTRLCRHHPAVLSLALKTPQYDMSYREDNVKGLWLLSAHLVGPEFEPPLKPLVLQQPSSVEDLVVLERLLDVAMSR